MRDIRDLEEREIREFILREKEKPFRARQLMEWLWKNPVNNFDRMGNLPAGLRRSLKENFSI